MKEFPWLCSVCDADFPGPAELAEHGAWAHEPVSGEDVLEHARRGGDRDAELAWAWSKLGKISYSGDDVGGEMSLRLVRLRQKAAEAIASDRRPALLEVHAELQALTVAAAEERDRQAAIAKVSLESYELVGRVLELLPEAAS